VALANAQAVILLLTSDDVAKLGTRFCTEHDSANGPC
jgi:hypothetical protein